MDEHRKNPFRRPPASGDQRPGLRQLPKDFDDLATGKTERLPRPRRPPAPLLDDREGAVIPGVRNTEARAVYDARVQALRGWLSNSDQAALLAGLEEVRQLRLWRARNVTDLRAFAESVIGLDAALAAQLQSDAEVLPDDVVAFALRLEAALLAQSDATVRLRPTPAGQLVVALELPVGDVTRAVDALESVGRAASGLRRFLRDGEPGRDAARRHPRDERDDSERASGERGRGPSAYPQRRERAAPPSRDERARPAKRFGDQSFGPKSHGRPPKRGRK